MEKSINDFDKFVMEHISDSTQEQSELDEDDHIETNIFQQKSEQVYENNGWFNFNLDLIQKKFYEKMIRSWYQSNKSDLNIMVFGNTGVGKSTLLNLLLEKEHFKTGRGKAITKEISKESCIKSDVTVNFYDVPGLNDSEGNDKHYLKEISNLIPKINIILFCFDLRRDRFEKNDYQMIDALNKGYGNTLWDKTIIVGLRANKVEKDEADTMLIEWQNEFYKITKREKPIPILLAGENERVLFGDVTWFDDLWLKMFMISDNDSQPAMLKIGFDMLYDTMITDENAKKRIFEKIQTSKSNVWSCTVL